jgi:hypothetical protein
MGKWKVSVKFSKVTGVSPRAALNVARSVKTVISPARAQGVTSHPRMRTSAAALPTAFREVMVALRVPRFLAPMRADTTRSRWAGGSRGKKTFNAGPNPDSVVKPERRFGGWGAVELSWVSRVWPCRVCYGQIG